MSRAAVMDVPGCCARDVADAWVCGILEAIFGTASSPQLPIVARRPCSPPTARYYIIVSDSSFLKATRQLRSAWCRGRRHFRRLTKHPGPAP